MINLSDLFVFEASASWAEADSSVVKVVEIVALDEPVRDVSVVDVGAVGIEVDANIVIEAVVPAEKGSKVGVGVDATVVIGPVVVIGFDSVVQVS